MLDIIVLKSKIFSVRIIIMKEKILGSHGAEYEDKSLLGYSTV
jgi:hypothetical protein